MDLNGSYKKRANKNKEHFSEKYMPLKGCLTNDLEFQDDAEVWRYEPRGQPNTVKVKHKCCTFISSE